MCLDTAQHTRSLAVVVALLACGACSRTNDLAVSTKGEGGEWATVLASKYDTCALREDSTLWCWGDLRMGGVAPQQYSTWNNWSALFRGNSSEVLGLRSDHDLWGVYYLWDMPMDPWSDHVHQYSGLPPIAEAKGLHEHTCAVSTDGRLWCWGANGFGQIGDGTTESRSEPTPPLNESHGWRHVAVGGLHSCGIRENGALWCWGREPYATGELLPDILAPTQLGNFINWSQVVAGEFHSCGLRLDGSLYCWGKAEATGTGKPSGTFHAPTLVSPETWTAVTAGNDYTCAIRDDGSMWCWGRNSAGKLGLGTTSEAPFMTPQRVGTDADWVAVSAGSNHTCGIRKGGYLFCWGSNSDGQLGDGTGEDRWTPVEVQ